MPPSCTLHYGLIPKRVFFALVILLSFILFNSIRTSSTRAFRSTFSQYRMLSTRSNLSTWLSNNKAEFLEDLKKDGAKSWTIAMGNEAGGDAACP